MKVELREIVRRVDNARKVLGDTGAVGDDERAMLGANQSVGAGP